MGLTVPYLLLVILLIVIPIGWLFGTSFVGPDGSFTFKNYIRLVESKAYYRIFVTTFEISVFTTLICILIGYPLTYFISQLPRRAANLCMIAGSDSVLDESLGANLCVVSHVATQGLVEQLRN